MRIVGNFLHIVSTGFHAVFAKKPEDETKAGVFKKAIEDFDTAKNNYDQNKGTVDFKSLKAKVLEIDKDFKALKGAGLKAFFFPKKESEKLKNKAHKTLEELQVKNEVYTNNEMR